MLRPTHEHTQAVWSAIALGAILMAGCKSSEPAVVTTPAPAISAQETRVSQETGVTVESDALVLRHRLAVVAGDAPPGAETVAQAVAQALRQRGFEILDGAEPEKADLVVAVWSATRAGAPWGGIPSQQLVLRYSLLDARQQSALTAGTDSSSFADPTPRSATLGALGKAAEKMARKLRTVVAGLPPPESRPPPPPPPEIPAVPLAALPFRNATSRANLAGWCESLSSIAAQELQRTNNYRIVERARLGEILKEEDIAAAFGANAQIIRRLGQQLSVDLLLVGEVASRPNGDLVISARLVNARDAEVRQVIHATGPAARVGDLEQDFRRQLVPRAETWLTRQMNELRRAPIIWPDAGPGR